MGRAVWRRIYTALATASAAHFAVNMSWVQEAGLSADRLCHWEASLDLILEDINVGAVCQYDLALHPPECIRAGLRTHPIVLLEGRLVSNPFYEAPCILKHEPALNRCDADAGTIEAMLRRLSETD
jgi:hypothetical protein